MVEPVETTATGVIMPDMYDKLGDMLNEALESGKIPKSQINNDQKKLQENEVDSGHFDFKYDEKSTEKSRTTLKSEKKQQIPTGEVIKLPKYTYNMQFPSQIQSALITLDIAYPFIIKDITTAYHKKLKQIHPDTKNTIHDSYDVQNNRQLTIDEVRNSYKILCDFFGIK